MKTSFPFLFIIPLLLACSAGQAQTGQSQVLATVPAHPRILLLAGEEEGIRATIASDSTWKNLHQAILDECDSLLTVAPVERIQIGRRLLDKSRECLRRIFYFAYAYRLSHEATYLQRAEKELLAVAAFTDWNPSHFLDVAEMTMGMAIGYDWLHQDLSPSSKAAIKEAILKKGIEPSLDTRYNSWLKASHNWNQVGNAGMAYGALAIFEDHPELARQIIARSIETIALPMEDYNPDGAYPEGYSYWGYGTSFQVLFNSAIEKLFGKDAGLAESPGFMKTAGYMLHMTGPSGNSFNYSDAGSDGALQPAMFWFAKKLNDPSLLWVERSRLVTTNARLHTRNRLLPAILIWSQGIGMKDIPVPAHTSWVGTGKNPVALMRTSWRDPNAVYVGFKGGSPSVNHAHMDAGSFILEADGVRWAMDFGMQNYESLESKGVQLWGKEQDSQRWKVFRYTNQVHNTLTVNQGLQWAAGYAPLTAYADLADFTYAIADLTEVYQKELAGARRGVAIAGKQYVVVRDELETLNAPATIRWTLLTDAAVRISGSNEVQLTKDGQILLLKIQQPAKVKLKTWSTDPPNEYDALNAGTSLVGFEVVVPTQSKEAITVLLIPGGRIKSTKKIPPLDSWTK